MISINANNIYYELTLKTNTDGDYGYNRIECETNEGTNILYFETRDDAIAVLREHLTSVINTIHSSRDIQYIKEKYLDMIDELNDYESYRTGSDNLIIEHDFGNPESYYSIRKVTLVAKSNYFRFE